MIRVAVGELSPATLVFLRTGLAAPLLTPIAAARGELGPLLARAETRLTSSITGLLIAGVPLIGALVVTLTGEREREGARRWVGLPVGIAGVAALVGLDVGQLDAVVLAEITCVAVGYAVGPIILARRLGRLPALGVVAASLVVSALLYAPFAAAEWPASTPSAHVLESVAGLALVCTAVAFLLFFALTAEVGPVRGTMITYVNPAVAALVGVLLLNERLTTGMVVGFVLVLAGCLLATGRTPEAVAEP